MPDRIKDSCRFKSALDQMFSPLSCCEAEVLIMLREISMHSLFCWLSCFLSFNSSNCRGGSGHRRGCLILVVLLP